MVRRPDGVLAAHVAQRRRASCLVSLVYTSNSHAHFLTDDAWRQRPDAAPLHFGGKGAPWSASRSFCSAGVLILVPLTQPSGPKSSRSPSSTTKSTPRPLAQGRPDRVPARVRARRRPRARGPERRPRRQGGPAVHFARRDARGERHRDEFGPPCGATEAQVPRSQICRRCEPRPHITADPGSHTVADGANAFRSAATSARASRSLTTPPRPTRPSSSPRPASSASTSATASLPP